MFLRGPSVLRAQTRNYQILVPPLQLIKQGILSGVVILNPHNSLLLEASLFAVGTLTIAFKSSLVEFLNEKLS